MICFCKLQIFLNCPVTIFVYNVDLFTIISRLTVSTRVLENPMSWYLIILSNTLWNSLKKKGHRSLFRNNWTSMYAFFIRLYKGYVRNFPHFVIIWKLFYLYTAIKYPKYALNLYELYIAIFFYYESTKHFETSSLLRKYKYSAASIYMYMIHLQMSWYFFLSRWGC